MKVELRPHVLCVDDERAVLEGLELTLGRRFRVAMATSGAAGLAALEQSGDIVAIVSDMRMPGMDGAAFLARARVVAPDASRILLTGQADMKSAIAAVNDGQIFRFLTKPCPPAALVAAIDAACEHHRLVTAERVLLEQTLHGSISALSDVLAIVHPVAFGRAGRIKQLAIELADRVGLRPRWQLEVAAMLWPLGLIGVAHETAEKLFYGKPLDDAERAACARAPEVVDHMIGHIPRLEEVRAILFAVARHQRGGKEDAVVHRAAAILRVAMDVDTLETQGVEPGFIVDTLRGRRAHPNGTCSPGGTVYDAEILDALAAVRAAGEAQLDIRELALPALRAGMVFAEDVRLASGALLVARGGEISASFLARAGNFPVGAVPSRIRVIVPAKVKRLL
ncbi:MAG: response regulator [Deltaproteobacteria bacterium]|nr:response regulator [Deltaproteobacteria bacterium]